MIHLTLPDYADDICLLVVRLVVGFSFLVAARNKGRNIRKFAKRNGLPVFAAFIIMCVEFVAGTAMMVGFLPQISAIALMFLMLGTIRLHIFVWRSPYWADRGGWEYDLMLFILASVILVFGAGSYTLFP